MKPTRCQASRKVQFPTQIHAELKILAIQKHVHHPLYSYECPQCGYWHLTKNIDFQTILETNLLNGKTMRK